jgi:hypothetical protein
VAGTFRDVAAARGAFDGLMGDARASQDVDVAFIGSGDTYVVLVEAKTAPAYERARAVLREYGAVEDPNLNRVGGAARNALMHTTAGTGKTQLLVRWIVSFLMLQEAGLVEPSGLVALAMAAQSHSADRVTTDRPLRHGNRADLLEAADAELRAVTERLTVELRRKHPDLFDRRGRLRKTALSKRLTERLGGRRRLSGADLQALEDSANAEATRSVNAP